MIPPFEDSGLLPAGIHRCRLEDVEKQLAFSPKRCFLIEGLRKACNALRIAGCKGVYLDGSFVSSKQQPGDFDGCWCSDGVDVQGLDPVLLDFANGRLRQKIKFQGELFPFSQLTAEASATWLDFFQSDKETGRVKGILLIDFTEDIE